MDNIEFTPLFIARAMPVPKAVALSFSSIRNNGVLTLSKFGRLLWSVFLQRTLYLRKYAASRFHQNRITLVRAESASDFSFIVENI